MPPPGARAGNSPLQRAVVKGRPRLESAGLAREQGGRVFMLLQAASSVLALGFGLPQEFSQYPRELRALIDVLVPVAEV